LALNPNYMKYNLLLLLVLLTFSGCKKDKQDSKTGEEFFVNEDAATFSQISSLDIGDSGAAEISAFDPSTNRLFVVNNGAVNKIDVIDFKDPSNMKVIGSILMAPYGGAVNSVAVSDGKLAAAIEW
jgi:DNA-binding beta-propeller fold protein YncE